MAIHNDLGKIGEELAANYLIKNGYMILERDWRSGKRDLDLIAWKDGTIVFVEVKTRRNYQYGDPIEAITDRKIRSIVASADCYVRYKRLDCPVRYDVITVVGSEPPFDITHHIEAFHSPLW